MAASTIHTFIESLYGTEIKYHCFGVNGYALVSIFLINLILAHKTP